MTKQRFVQQIVRHLIFLRVEYRRWCEPWYVAHGILGALISALTPILVPLLIADRRGSAGKIGLVMAMLNVGALSSPLWGFVADRLRTHRTLFVLGFVLIGGCFNAFLVFNHTLLFAGVAFIEGIGVGLANTMASLFVVEFQPQAQWVRRISWLQNFNGVGQVLGLVLAGILGVDGGLSAGMVLAALAILVTFFTLPVPQSGQKVTQLVETRLEVRRLARQAESLADEIMYQFNRPTGETLRDFRRAFESHFGRFLLGWFFVFLASSAYGSFYSVLMRALYHVHPAAASELYALAAGLSLLCYGPIGRWGDRRGALRVFQFGIVLRLAAFIALLLATRGSSLTRFVFVPVLICVTELSWPLLTVGATNLSAELCEMNQGSAMGLFNASGALASALGALFGGVLANFFGYASILGMATASTAICFFLTVGLARSRQASEEAAAAGAKATVR